MPMFKKSGGKIFAVQFNKAEERALDQEIKKQNLMEQADDGWLARKKLKDIGCDIEEWYREEGGKTDA